MSQEKINTNPADKGRRVIISGGGTGGHVFPAIAIANQLKALDPEIKIHFVGATGKIEMIKVPKAGYSITGLPIRGIQRKLTLKNLAVPFRLLASLWKAFRLINSFRPQVAVGVGGYASFPTLQMANRKGIPTLIQEQNSYAGVANRMLRSKANLFCVAYDGLEKVFPKDKIIQTGNPVRLDLLNASDSADAAKKHFGLDSEKTTILIMGGSLGARTLNDAMAANAKLIKQQPEVQWLWQAGSLYVDEFENSESAKLPNVQMQAFIDRMDLAYKMADLVICRAGALTVSEICLLGKACILIPSPNVAEDHQTKNAMALVNKGAAVLIKDKVASEEMVKKGLAVIEDQGALRKLSEAAKAMGKPNATKDIAQYILKLIDGENPKGDASINE